MVFLKKVYKRNGFRVKRMNKWRENRLKIYTPLLGPQEEWYPSRSACFTFGVKYSPELLMELVPENFNPSVWTNKHNLKYTLRVPIDRRDETRKLLAKQGFWFHTGQYLWYKRVRRYRKRRKIYG